VSELVLRGHRISARRAYELGLLNYVVAPDEVLPAAQAIAAELAALPPIHLQRTKELLMMVRPTVSGNVSSIAAPRIRQELLQLEDTREARLAFAEKRAPVFQGR
jgi:enoyl-CoA hydratase/carnithine racemase